MNTENIYREGLVDATLALSVAAASPVLGQRRRANVAQAFARARALLHLGEAPPPLSLIDWVSVVRGIEGGDRARAEAAIRAVAGEAQAAGLSRQDVSAILSSQYLSRPDQGQSVQHEDRLGDTAA